jgi:hypothetical protein
MKKRVKFKVFVLYEFENNILQKWQKRECLTLSQLMLHICRVSKTFGEWYQKTHKTEDTNKLTLLALRPYGGNPTTSDSCSVIDS